MTASTEGATDEPERRSGRAAPGRDSGLPDHPRHPLHVRIQHHPARAHLIPGLLERLDGLDVEIVEHASNPPSPWAGYKRCLDHLPDTSHLLIVQDDAIPVPGFVPAVHQIAEANPDVPVCLFLARLPRDASAKAQQAVRQNRRYIELSWRSFLPVVAVLWPTHKAAEFREWSRENTRFPGVGAGEPRSDDAMGGRWKMITRQTVRACVPSIVQHPDQEPSLIGRRAMWGKDANRVAALLAENATDYDWS